MVKRIKLRRDAGEVSGSCCFSQRQAEGTAVTVLSRWHLRPTCPHHPAPGHRGFAQPHRERARGAGHQHAASLRPQSQPKGVPPPTQPKPQPSTLPRPSSPTHGPSTQSPTDTANGAACTLAWPGKHHDLPPAGHTRAKIAMSSFSQSKGDMETPLGAPSSEGVKAGPGSTTPPAQGQSWQGRRRQLFLIQRQKAQCKKTTERKKIKLCWPCSCRKALLKPRAGGH